MFVKLCKGVTLLLSRSHRDGQTGKMQPLANTDQHTTEVLRHEHQDQHEANWPRGSSC